MFHTLGRVSVPNTEQTKTLKKTTTKLNLTKWHQTKSDLRRQFNTDEFYELKAIMLMVILKFGHIFCKIFKKS